MNKNNLVITILAVLVIIAGAFYYLQSNTKPVDNVVVNVQENSSATKNAPTENEPQPSPLNSTAEDWEKGQMVTGDFDIYSNGLAPNTLCFRPVEFDAYYCFSNQDEAKQLLNIDSAGTLGENDCDQIIGKANISYADFKPGYYNNGGGSVNLVTVNQIITPAECSPMS